MLYLTNPSTEPVRDQIRAGNLGMLTTPFQGNVIIPGAKWAADNGVFGKGWPGDERFLAWLRSRPAHVRHDCLFAAAPDVVGDATATLQRSAPWLPRIRELGYPVALVGQDGMEDLPIPWGEFDAMFLGGGTEWKLGAGARTLAEQALSRGLHVHMGRVNSLKRFRYAASIGCDSVDGTFIKFGPNINLPIVLGWTRLVSTG